MKTRADIFLQQVFWKSSWLAGAVSIVSFAAFVAVWVCGYCWTETGLPLYQDALCWAMLLGIGSASIAFLAQTTRQATRHVALKMIESGRLQRFDFNEER